MMHSDLKSVQVLKCIYRTLEQMCVFLKKESALKINTLKVQTCKGMSIRSQLHMQTTVN